jgi:GcrA cell cycle regulator
MCNTGWTDERVESLKTLWADGLSASQVAKSLGGVTRNAVIGKIHRLGLGGRAAGGTVSRPPRLPRLRSSAGAPRPTNTHRVVSAPQPAVAAATGAVEIADGPGLISSVTSLQGHVCKWPIGDPLTEDFSFCGQATEAGPYCGRHDRAAHKPCKPAPLTRDPFVRRVLAGYAA